MTRRLDSRFASERDSPGQLLWRVTNAWQAIMRAALKPHGLTHVQFVLLASLTWQPSDEVVTQQQLAANARTDPMMTSQVLRALESQGLVRREPHPTDGRARVLEVTPAGRSLVNRAIIAVEAADQEFFGGLGARLSPFTDALRTLDAVDPGSQPEV